MNNHQENTIKNYYVKKRYKPYCKPDIKISEIKFMMKLLNFKLFNEKDIEFQSFIEKEVDKKNLNNISNEEDDYLSKEECIESGEEKQKEI